MTDGEEEAVNRNIIMTLVGFAFALHQMNTLYPVLTIETDGIMLEENLDVLRIHHPFLHHLRGTEEGFTNNQIHFLTQTRQVERILAGRIATTHHGCHLLTIEEAVASGTGRDTLTTVFLLIGQAQVLR